MIGSRNKSRTGSKAKQTTASRSYEIVDPRLAEEVDVPAKDWRPTSTDQRIDRLGSVEALGK